MDTEKDRSPLDAAFYVDRSDRGRLRLTGRDRQSFLQGMVTNDVARLQPGQGCYAFVLDPTGHVLADARVICTGALAHLAGDYLLLDVEPDAAPTVAETLNKLLVMEKCRIEDVTDQTAQALVGGRQAPAALARLGIANAQTWTEGQNAVVQIADAETIVTATRLIPGPAFDIYLPDADALADVLLELRAAGAAEITEAALDAFRVEAGVPRGGVDLNARVLAPETGVGERALSRTKGCYVGQEIVARIDARGHTNRTFVGFLVEGETVPASGDKVGVDGKEIGWITSAVVSPTLDRVIALGYLRHEHAEPGTSVQIGDARATVAALPFVPGEA